MREDVKGALAGADSFDALASDLPGGGRLYTSRGTGTWGPRMRFLSPPEVTIIDVVPAAAPDRECRPLGPAGAR